MAEVRKQAQQVREWAEKAELTTMAEEIERLAGRGCFS